MRLFSFLFILIAGFQPLKTVAGNTDTITARYEESYRRIEGLIKNNGLFKEAVFITEKTFGIGNISQKEYFDFIDYLVILSKQVRKYHNAYRYHLDDSSNYLLNQSIFSIICDTLNAKVSTFKRKLTPFSYNFDDPTGKMDWSNMFVTKMFVTNKGNCHSLAYLYKILSDEVGARSWLALAPNHIYIRNYSEGIGWYNSELTSGIFPTDAWVATTGYVSADAIRSGVYMDTLDNQQSIALCMLDLAKEYEFQTHNYYDGFILKCCNLVLQFHAVNPMALLLKAETLKKMYLKQTEDKNPNAASMYAEMEKTYITLAKLGYREMPEKMYLDWLRSLTKQREKYSNKKVSAVTATKKTGK